MTNNQNWPDRVYGYFSTAYDITDTPIGKFQCYGENPQSLMGSVKREMEYISATKVREIQSATVKAALEAAIEQLGLTYNEKLEVRSIDPEEILKGVTP